jgi:membrane fusion protein (multidrug efflux system)
MPAIPATNEPTRWPTAGLPSSSSRGAPGHGFRALDIQGHGKALPPGLSGNSYIGGMALNKLHTWVAVVGIVTVGAAAWWWQREGGPQRKEMTATPAGARAPAAGAPARGGPGGGGPAMVEVGKVEAVRIEDDAQAVGSLRAVQTVIVRPEVSGRVVRLGFADGARVRKGQLLVQLDNTLQEAQLKQALAQASIARTNLQRSRELQAENFVSQSAVDQNAAALQVAEAQVALARAQLSKLAILAPFDGVVGIRSVALGDYVKDGADLVSLEDRSRMWVDFRLPERFVGRTKVGQPVHVTLDAMPGREFAGTVEALDALVDANGRSLLVRAGIERPGSELKSGMFARARIVFAVRERALMVPEEALVPQGGKQFVIKAVPGAGASPPTASAANGLADGGGPLLVSQRLEAKLGVRQAGKVEILEGLAPGDLIVTAGQERLMRGDALPLRVIDLDKPTGASRSSRPPAPGGAASGNSAAPRLGAPA